MYFSLLYLSEPRFCLATQEGYPSILVFEVKSFESKRRFIGVVEGSDIGIGHVSTICTLIVGIQQQAVALLAISTFRAVVTQFPMSGPYCSFSFTVFSCASGSAYFGSSLPQEANARAAIRRKRSFVCFILLMLYIVSFVNP